ncbi:MAG: cytochrome c oxidase accessory protein CcoG [Alphaproteobacteria bacterium]|nr:cytochrome c oxidase accessory protein CcoG [Alphaproteobacteria bacterium]
MNAPLLTTVRAVADETKSLAAEGVARSTAAPTNSAQARTLYRARQAIYPKLVHGRFRLLKFVGMAVMLGIYYGLPWIRWERGPNAPDQAVLVDLVRERFYFFWIEIWPQEVYYVTGLLILAALGLFLVTALFGRVWCGYACPQTVWTDLYIMVERLIEGDRNARIRLDKSPWTFEKLAKKVAKHIAWILIAAMTGGAWILYFHDAPTLAATLFQGTADLSAYVFLGVLTFTTYWLAGHMREQVCTFMCPWPRIQAALIDKDTLTVTYRTDRGEPRGPHKKGQPWEGRGHCIDCNQCVAACPMGIDIRDGDQLECINCALCIDACNDVMKRVDLPFGLIAYDTHENIERRAHGEKARFRPFRPRLALYAVAIAIVAGVMLFGLSTRATLDLSILRERNPTFVRLSDGSIRNAYAVKIQNHKNMAREFQLLVEGPKNLEIKVVGANETVDVEGDKLREIRVLLTVPAPSITAASMPVTFKVVDAKTHETTESRSVFLSDGAGS